MFIILIFLVYFFAQSILQHICVLWYLMRKVILVTCHYATQTQGEYLYRGRIPFGTCHAGSAPYRAGQSRVLTNGVPSSVSCFVSRKIFDNVFLKVKSRASNLRTREELRSRHCSFQQTRPTRPPVSGPFWRTPHMMPRRKTPLSTGSL